MLCYRKMQVAPESWHGLGPGRICFDWSILVLHLIKRRPPGLHKNNKKTATSDSQNSGIILGGLQGPEQM